MRACAVGDGVFLTFDGGSSWQRARAAGGAHSLSALDFLDENEGWAAGATGVFHTTDAGLTWNLVDGKDSPARHVAGRVLHFTDAKSGWIAGQYGAVYRTRDGGETWARVPVPAPANTETPPDVFRRDVDRRRARLARRGVRDDPPHGGRRPDVDARRRRHARCVLHGHRVRRRRRLDRGFPPERRRPIRRLPHAGRRGDVGARAHARRRGAACDPGARRGHGMGRRRPRADRAAADAPARGARGLVRETDRPDQLVERSPRLVDAAHDARRHQKPSRVQDEVEALAVRVAQRLPRVDGQRVPAADLEGRLGCDFPAARIVVDGAQGALDEVRVVDLARRAPR